VNQSKINKSTINFSLTHKTGSLASVLSVFAFYDMNLQKIQSYPVIGIPGKYSFYVSDDVNKFKGFGLNILEREIDKIEKVIF